MIKALIVEDDPKHQKNLVNLLRQVQPRVQVVAVCTNVVDAYQNIVAIDPDLVFLDVELDAGDNGFDLLKKFEQPDFAVIFTTQHNNTDNVIGALRACALDFLPKPLLYPELGEALKRYDKSSNAKQVQTLKDNISSIDKQVNAIWVSGTEGKIRIEVQDILYCESHNVWTNFYLVNPVRGKKAYTSSQSIKEWERNLLNSSIMRVHNEHLVNLSYVRTYNSRLSGSAELILSTEVVVPVSKSRKNEVKDRLKLRK